MFLHTNNKVKELLYFKKYWLKPCGIWGPRVSTLLLYYWDYTITVNGYTRFSTHRFQLAHKIVEVFFGFTAAWPYGALDNPKHRFCSFWGSASAS